MLSSRRNLTNCRLGPCGDDHNVTLACFTIRSCPHTGATIDDEGHIGQIADLTVSQLHIDVDQEYLVRDGSEDERGSSRTANLTNTDNCDPCEWLPRP